MSTEWKIKHYSEGCIPGIVDHFRFSAKKIPDWRASEARVIYLVQVEFCQRMAKRKFLTQVIVLGDVLGPLVPHVTLHAIALVIQVNTKVFPGSNPWKIISTKL